MALRRKGRRREGEQRCSVVEKGKDIRGGYGPEPYKNSTCYELQHKNYIKNSHSY